MALGFAFSSSSEVGPRSDERAAGVDASGSLVGSFYGAADSMRQRHFGKHAVVALLCCPCRERPQRDDMFLAFLVASGGDSPYVALDLAPLRIASIQDAGNDGN